MFFGCHPAGICFSFCSCNCMFLVVAVACFLVVIPQGSASRFAVAVACFWLSQLHVFGCRSCMFLVVIPQGSASRFAVAVACFWLSQLHVFGCRSCMFLVVAVACFWLSSRRDLLLVLQLPCRMPGAPPFAVSNQGWDIRATREPFPLTHSGIAISNTDSAFTSPFVLPLVDVFGVEGSCRHPERSEGSRRDHPATTFRIFQPRPFPFAPLPVHLPLHFGINRRR
jgi:hypothetical protein